MMSRLPKKITPDALLETYVEVHYTTNSPVEVAFGKFYTALINDFEYLRPPAQLLNSVLGGQIQAQDEPLFRGQGVQFRLRDGYLGVSCSAEYLGWSIYQQRLSHILQLLMETGEIVRFTRIGLRYINALPWRPANEQLLVQLPTLPPELIMEQFQYRAQLRTTDGYRVNLMLSDSQRVAGRQGPQSLFDLDIIWEQAPLTTLQEALSKLDETHRREKEVFFGLLNPDYLASLKPEYE
ncbi:TIGR04255 family protein [uncultured Hymenobacter sp.]|uniref:TIGR04255 family protein n=1 Tax=uncultured Hymenobacter sp. TaxID=170016 RepID=UPI0035C9F5AC